VVPNTKSRAALGELSDRGLHDIFSAEFGAAGSAAFERARENFIVSEAAYAVASYLLQVRAACNCVHGRATAGNAVPCVWFLDGCLVSVVLQLVMAFWGSKMHVA
jgi:hypothetical protein